MVRIAKEEWRRLLDAVRDPGFPVYDRIVKILARRHFTLGLNEGFLIMVAQKRSSAGGIVIPRDFPTYGKEFLKQCWVAKNRYDMEQYLPVSNFEPLVRTREYIAKLRLLAPLSSRDQRYIDQLFGFPPFTEIERVELAKQDEISPAAVTQRWHSIQRKLFIFACAAAVSRNELRLVLTKR